MSVSYDRPRRRRPQGGSIALLVLFVCLGMALVLQALTGIVICAERESRDEKAGRARVAEKDSALAALRDRALSIWQPVPWGVVGSEQSGLEGQLTALPGSGWVLRAEVRETSGEPEGAVSAWIERGRDGVDLPLAAVVATQVDKPSSRSLPWLDRDATDGSGGTPAPPGDAASTTTAYLKKLPGSSDLADGCAAIRLATTWKVDPGWLTVVSSAEARGGTVSLGSSVVMLSGRQGQKLVLSETVFGASGGGTAETDGPVPGWSAQSPLLVLVTGGADLDASALGDIYAVLVVDGGSISIDRTTVHGAVFATEDLDVGASGLVLFSRSVLRWATERSLTRARLVLGTRWEGTE